MDANEECHILCAQINDIIDGKDDGQGLNYEPWATVRRRLIYLLKHQWRLLRDGDKVRFGGSEGWHDTVHEAIDAAIAADEVAETTRISAEPRPTT